MHCSTSRLALLREALSEAGTEAAFIRDTGNIAWLTGFSGVFDDEQAHALFVSRPDEMAYLHSDSRYITALEREAAGTDIGVDADAVTFSKWAFDRWKDYRDRFRDQLPPHALLAVEDTMSLAQYRSLEKEFTNGFAAYLREVPAASVESALRYAYLPFKETDSLVLELRAIKDDEEISCLKAAQAITDEAFDHIAGFITVGMTEREVQLELDNKMMSLGADSLAFPSIVASGANGASPHAVVSNKKLEAGECVVMDFGARKDGYCSDMTRTVFLGQPDGDMARAWDALRRANETVEERLCAGMTGKEAHELAISVLDDAGFVGRMGHGLGHGVGMQVHESPTLSPRNERPLEPGSVVTVEPGIYIPQKFGMRLEDFGVVTESGFDVFTQTTHEMIVV